MLYGQQNIKITQNVVITQQQLFFRNLSSTVLTLGRLHTTLTDRQTEKRKSVFCDQSAKLRNFYEKFLQPSNLILTIFFLPLSQVGQDQKVSALL